MKIRQLIAELEKLDPELEVIVSTDSEGNGFDEMRVISPGYNYNPQDREIGISELTEEDINSGYTDEDVMEDGVPCVVLWP